MVNKSTHIRDIVLLLLTFPVWGSLLAISILITLIRDGKPIFYSQKRIGLHGKPFEIFKIRTMLTDTRLADDLRITQNGYFLRGWSLDELPQIWNVIKGEMSIVGPRPLIWAYREELPEAIALHRNSVRPGLTGWAQVNGRNELSWEEKFELDAWYIHNRSFLLDLRIIFSTIPVWAKRKGIYTKSGRMMPEVKMMDSEEKQGKTEPKKELALM